MISYSRKFPRIPVLKITLLHAQIQTIQICFANKISREFPLPKYNSYCEVYKIPID